MTAPRKRGSKDLPTNLYTNKVRGNIYFVYRNPITGQRTSFGTDRQQAIQSAKRCNEKLMETANSVDALVSRVVSCSLTVSELISEFHVYKSNKVGKNGRTPAESTLDFYAKRYPHINDAMGSKAVSDVHRLDITRFLNTLTESQQFNYRKILMMVFKYAVHQGYIDDNPVEKTEPITYKVQRHRLSAEGFDAVYAIAPDWFRNAMDLARVTLARRSDLVNMEKSGLTGNKLRFFSMKPQKWIEITLGPKARSVIERTQDGVASKYIIHRKSARGVKVRERDEHWSKLDRETLTATFRELRDKSGFFDDLGKKERPTFHEIRALGAEEYRSAGVPDDQIQALMGHSDMATTEGYFERHGEKCIQAQSM